MFATAETGDKGQFLGSDPNFGFFDEEITQNLGLDLEFVYSGSETGSLAALDKAFANQDPLLMYFWTPHWARPSTTSSRWSSPRTTATRNAPRALENSDADGYAATTPTTCSTRRSAPNSRRRIRQRSSSSQNFQWTEEDQNQVGLAIQEKTDPLEAAQAWIDANPDVVEGWLPAA